MPNHSSWSYLLRGQMKLGGRYYTEQHLQQLVSEPDCLSRCLASSYKRENLDLRVNAVKRHIFCSKQSYSENAHFIQDLGHGWDSKFCHSILDFNTML